MVVWSFGRLGGGSFGRLGGGSLGVFGGSVGVWEFRSLDITLAHDGHLCMMAFVLMAYA